MKTNEQRINNIIGQLTGIKKMISENKKDCQSVLIQLKATKAAINSLTEKVIHDELESCLKKSKKENIKKMFKEIINNN